MSEIKEDRAWLAEEASESGKGEDSGVERGTGVPQGSVAAHAMTADGGCSSGRRLSTSATLSFFP